MPDSDVVVAPSLSVATAVMTWLPTEGLVQVASNGAVVSMPTNAVPA